jgi:hypothetical protein
VWKGSYI